MTWINKTLGGPVEPVLPSNWNGIAVVGEAPGAAEIAHGVPFCGPSGRLLTKILDAAGLNKIETALVNTFRMQPAWSINADGKRKSNDISHYFTTDPSEANIRLPPFRGSYILKGPDEDVRDMWRFLRAIKPKVIVACGAVATWALTGEDAVGDGAGRVCETKAVDSPVIVTFHPAYALHRQDEKAAAMIAQHFAKAKRLLVEQNEKADELAVPF